MIGRVLDWTVLHTVKDGHLLHSGEQNVTDYNIEHWADYPFEKMTKQPKFKKILDVGSFDVNGSFADYDFFGRDPKWRDLVGCQEYIGIDLAEGRNVDMVMNAHDMSFADNTFDLILCLEMLEHDDDQAKSIKEMYRVLKPDCPLILTCPNQHSPEHHQGVSDHYTFITPKMLTGWLTDAGFMIKEYVKPTGKGAAHHMLYATKPKGLNNA